MGSENLYDSYESVSECPEWTERKLLFLLAEHHNKLCVKVRELEAEVERLKREKGPYSPFSLV